MLSPTHRLRLPLPDRHGDWKLTVEPRAWPTGSRDVTFLRQRVAGRWITWMSNHEIELAWTQQLADRTVGDHILIGGLGLGLLPQLLLRQPGRTVLVLENAPEVIDLVTRDWYMPVGLMVQQADVWEFLRYAPSAPRYDTIIMDIWSMVDEAARREIARLRQLAEPWLQPGGQYVAWGDVSTSPVIPQI